MREQIGHRYRQDGSQNKQQYIPPLQQASRHRAGHSAGLHPEDQQYLTGDINPGLIVADELVSEDEYEYDDEWPPRLPTSARRYQSLPDVTTKHGRVNVVSHYHEQPLRAHRTNHQQLPPQRQRYTEEIEQIQPNRHRRIHPLVWIGVFLMFLVLGWTGLNFVTSWYQGVQNDWTYGKQRHFEINAVVGHGDSATNPSHFTAENNNGQIIVIELPGNNVSKAKIYQLETVPGNAGNPPVKISFQDMNADGRPDMLVQIGDGSATLYVTMYNNGTEFVSKL